MTDPNAPFRDPAFVGRLAEAICREAEAIDRTVRIMEVCGTHTMSAARNGLHALLPGNVRLVSGPGCPVCVTEPGYLEAACDLARASVGGRRVVVATFGDMVRVPARARGRTVRSLETERAEGADIRPVYSPLDALAIARRNPDREVVFLGIGFETTAPAIGATVHAAAREGLRNFSVFSAAKTMPSVMRAIASSPDIALDAYLCPGHVSTVIGGNAYRFLPAEYGIACAVAGFEPADILAGILAILRQVREANPRVEIAYRRAVRPDGNPAARAVLAEVFEPADTSWRGLGTVLGSGLALRPKYAPFDAARRFSIVVPEVPPPRGCLCGAILRGAAEPTDCPLFGRACTPARPVGPCMVSSEGACAAAYRYGPRRAAA